MGWIEGVMMIVMMLGTAFNIFRVIVELPPTLCAPLLVRGYVLLFSE